MLSDEDDKAKQYTNKLKELGDKGLELDFDDNKDSKLDFNSHKEINRHESRNINDKPYNFDSNHDHTNQKYVDMDLDNHMKIYHSSQPTAKFDIDEHFNQANGRDDENDSENYGEEAPSDTYMKTDRNKMSDINSNDYMEAHDSKGLYKDETREIE